MRELDSPTLRAGEWMVVELIATTGNGINRKYVSIRKEARNGMLSADFATLHIKKECY